MKNIYFKLLIFALTALFMSCEKTDDPISAKDDLLIENYVHDADGIVFKITNDVGHAYNYQEEVLQEIDSIFLMKFHISGSINPMDTNQVTWFTKKGQYVCWRYKYLHEGYKYLCVGFPNYFRRHEPPYRFCIYLSAISCTQTSTTYPEFKIMFPIVDDTVRMRLSDIRPDRFKIYK